MMRAATYSPTASVATIATTASTSRPTWPRITSRTMPMSVHTMIADTYSVDSHRPARSSPLRFSASTTIITMTVRVITG